MTRDLSAQLIDTLQLSESQWAELSTKLDRHTPQDGGQRKHERVPFRKLSQIAVAIQQPDQSWTKYIVRSCDLSSGGIGFIHGSFVHTDSRCRVILRQTDGGAACIEGVVRRCQHLQGRAHIVGVMFNEEIQLERFVTPGANKPSEPDRDAG